MITNPAWPHHVKIGLTKVNPADRLSSLNVGDPHKAYAYAVLVAVPDVRVAERLLHDTLGASRAGGEWFKCPTEVAVRLAKSLRHRRHT